MSTQLPHLPDIQRLSPLVIRILGGNPSKFTLQGTNTYLIGTGPKRILIDTGEGHPAWSQHLSSVLAAENATITHALLTHRHPDHISGVPDLLLQCPSALIHKYTPTPTQQPISHAQVFATEGATLTALYCPGHTSDHTALILQEENAMFTGDNVLGHGTAVFEDLSLYTTSLAQMQSQCTGRAYPGHGAVIEDGKARIGEYILHRQQREEEILRALRDATEHDGSSAKQGKTPAQLVRVVYRDTPANLHEVAERGLVLVLRKLLAEGKVVQQEAGAKWLIAEKAAL